MFDVAHWKGLKFIGGRRGNILNMRLLYTILNHKAQCIVVERLQSFA